MPVNFTSYIAPTLQLKSAQADVMTVFLAALHAIDSYQCRSRLALVT
jgi:hypothetical protein